jgi:hypothetical protein
VSSYDCYTCCVQCRPMQTNRSARRTQQCGLRYSLHYIPVVLHYLLSFICLRPRMDLYILTAHMFVHTCTAWSMLKYINVFAPFGCGFTYQLYLTLLTFMLVKDMCRCLLIVTTATVGRWRGLVHGGESSSAFHCQSMYFVWLTYVFGTWHVLLYSALVYSTLPYSTLLYSTLLYCTLLYSTLLYSTLLVTSCP